MNSNSPSNTNHPSLEHIGVEADPSKIKSYDADLFAAVIATIGPAVVNIWLAADWQIHRVGCSCGLNDHVRVHWRRLDGAVTGELLLHGGWTRSAECIVDEHPKKQTLAGLELNDGTLPGFTMALIDGAPVYVGGRSSSSPLS